MPLIDELDAKISVLQNRVRALNDIAQAVDSPPATLTADDLRKKKQLFNVMILDVDTLYSEFDKTFRQLIVHCNKSSPKIHRDFVDIRTTFETNLYNAKAVEMSLSSTSGGGIGSPTKKPSATAAPVMGVSLPKLHIPEFSGKIEEWRRFLDLFNTAVHQNQQLSDVQRFTYLMSLLKGEPLSLISSLPLTASNYHLAWQTLKSRYENLKLLTRAHLDVMFNCPPALVKQSATIRNLAAVITENIGALRGLDQPVDESSFVIVHLMRQKLDTDLRESWEKETLANPSPTVSDFTTFLNNEASVLECLGVGFSPQRGSYRGTSSRTTNLFVHTDPEEGPSRRSKPNPSAVCVKCQGGHSVFQCSAFKKMTAIKRWELAKFKHLCLKCLNTGHFVRDCSSKTLCRLCKSNHHELLHRDFTSTKQEANTAEDATTSCMFSQNKESNFRCTSVLLGTVQAMVLDRWGSYQQVRAVLDPGSESNFVSQACVDRLGLDVKKTNSSVSGLRDSDIGHTIGKAKCCLAACNGELPHLTVDCFVLDYLVTSPSKQVEFETNSWEHIEGLKLADPDFFISREVEMLLGAKWFVKILKGGMKCGNPGTPDALETIWGWALMGEGIQSGIPTSKINTLCTQTYSLEDMLHRFWRTEEPPAASCRSEEEIEAENHFVETHSRDSSGRYVVELPFKSSQNLGESRTSALNRFRALEKRLDRNPDLKKDYELFMKDYIAQGHMSIVSENSESSEENYYIPHHGIHQGEARKLRVVFDASMKTTSGASLNDALHIGPKLQLDIVSIISLLRLNPVVLIADIRQMYRNIYLSQKHWRYQRIFWRGDPTDSLEEYELRTVTYGVSSSPFLAIRTLHQLARDEGVKFPKAADVVLHNTYMDDIVCSVSSIEEAKGLRKELEELMRKGGFTLSKWASNSEEVLEGLRGDQCSVPTSSLSFENELDHSLKILGLIWCPKTDQFTYSIRAICEPVTRRGLLSEIARIYDPLGWISPVTFYAKCIMQYLCKTGLDWDEALPVEVTRRWLQFREELPHLSRFSMSRHLSANGAHCQLHGFSDASEKGYGGVVYLRVESHRNVKTALLMAKSRVAPLKQVSLPRLELCGILVTAKLLRFLSDTLERHLTISSIVVWSDSTVALSWVRESPHRWKTYVANRVSQIQDYVRPKCVRHVPTKINPADCLSRGLTPLQLIEHPIWQSGPDFLKMSPDQWPPDSSSIEKKNIDVLKSEEKHLVLTSRIKDEVEDSFEEEFTSFSKLRRVVAQCLRFVKRCRGLGRPEGSLTTQELSEATFVCIRHAQKQEFSADLQLLKAGKMATHRLRRLNPFVDDKGIIRVGGRIRFAKVSFNQRHPILLPRRHHLTRLIIRFYHQTYLHPGALNLHSILQTQFWIIGARSMIRNEVNKCVRCFRTNPKPMQPMMGDLPAIRLTEVKAFSRVGVDYYGPFGIKMGRLRTNRMYKSYVCVFVCLVTKAVHLELVSELTTAGFLAAFRRFVARRGTVTEIISDQGTNFVGAKRIFDDFAQLMKSKEHNSEISNCLAEKGINWNLNPASSPHFGGIFEAAVKSAKRLLSRVIANQKLTYEEFNTFLVQVESILNSRPLCPISSDPTDLTVLTPGHFLNMEPPAVIPEIDSPQANWDNRTRWSLLQQMHRAFWKRWRSEYLSTLQLRGKWSTGAPNLEQGALVIVKEDHTSPLKWKLARIVKVYPGHDGVVRVADILTTKGVLRRPVVKLCPLPKVD